MTTEEALVALAQRQARSFFLAGIGIFWQYALSKICPDLWILDVVPKPCEDQVQCRQSLLAIHHVIKSALFALDGDERPNEILLILGFVGFPDIVEQLLDVTLLP